MFDVQVLQLIVTPDSTEPLIAQLPAHDWRHPHEIAAVPQVFSTHEMSSAPPPSIMQIWPGWQVIDWQKTDVHGPVSTVHVPPPQLATVRPAAAHSS